MSAVEVRKPREWFTKKLERICRALDESSERTVTHRDFLSDTHTSQPSYQSGPLVLTHAELQRAVIWIWSSTVPSLKATLSTGYRSRKRFSALFLLCAITPGLRS
jgi:hypothetical protein